MKLLLKNIFGFIVLITINTLYAEDIKNATYYNSKGNEYVSKYLVLEKHYLLHNTMSLTDFATGKINMQKLPQDIKNLIYLGIENYSKAIEIDKNNANGYDGRAHAYYVAKYIGDDRKITDKQICEDAQKACALKQCNTLNFLKNIKICNTK